MFLGTGNSFLAFRIHFEDYFSLGAATVGARGGWIIRLHYCDYRGGEFDPTVAAPKPK